MGIATEVARALDPVAFAVAAMGDTPDPWQAAALRSTARRQLWLCARQSGKSTIASVLAVHTALFRPESLVLLVSPAWRQSAELFRKCLQVYGDSGGRGLVAPTAESKLSLELANGSRIVSLPGKEGTIRGYSKVALIVADESQKVPDELYMAVRPMLAVSGGRLVALATAWGRRGWFWAEWSGREDWERTKVPHDEVPPGRYAPGFIDEERRTQGPTRFASEYECTFVDPEGAVFRMEDVLASVKDYPQWNLKQYLQPTKPAAPSTSG
jgi:hypothetical protein